MHVCMIRASQVMLLTLGSGASCSRTSAFVTKHVNLLAAKGWQCSAPLFSHEFVCLYTYISFQAYSKFMPNLIFFFNILLCTLTTICTVLRYRGSVPLPLEQFVLYVFVFIKHSRSSCPFSLWEKSSSMYGTLLFSDGWAKKLKLHFTVDTVCMSLYLWNIPGILDYVYYPAASWRGGGIVPAVPYVSPFVCVCVCVCNNIAAPWRGIHTVQALLFLKFFLFQ